MDTSIFMDLPKTLQTVFAQFIGTKREIGYGKPGIWSKLFSALAGLVITLFIKKKQVGG